VTRLAELLAAGGMKPLSPGVDEKFTTYLELLLKWNSKLNLTAIRSSEEILRRHFVECIFCAEHLPKGITTLLDFGSGAGFPGIPIALCRPEISVTLAESQAKKATFLREAVRTVGLGADVYAGRVEGLTARFDAITLRAVDKMSEAIPAAIARLNSGGLLVLLVGDDGEFRQRYPAMQWAESLPLPDSEHSVLLMGRKG
jgi:16S rRNA (guanine527-N7)-methyltransferase